MNSILFINVEACGICLLKVIPARNAPIMGSIPAIFANPPAIKTIVITKTYWDIGSPVIFLKNHLPINGNIKRIKPRNRKVFNARINQNV